MVCEIFTDLVWQASFSPHRASWKSQRHALHLVFHRKHGIEFLIVQAATVPCTAPVIILLYASSCSTIQSKDYDPRYTGNLIPIVSSLLQLLVFGLLMLRSQQQTFPVYGLIRRHCQISAVAPTYTHLFSSLFTLSNMSRPQRHTHDSNTSPLTSTKGTSLDAQHTVTDPPTYVVNLDLPPRRRWSVCPSVTWASETY